LSVDVIIRREREVQMPKVHLRATGPSSFEWVGSLKKATADYRKAAMVTLKQFRSSKLTEVPGPHLMKSEWVITSNK
jgi:hypothetical protein